MVRKNKPHWNSAKFKGDNFEQGALGAFNVSVQGGFYCDTDYILDLYKEPRTVPNGRLDIAELQRKDGSPPSFLFRWDEKVNQLDVDIRGVSRKIAGRFEKGEGGYAGHHPLKVQSDALIFEVDIYIPDKHIFNGCVKFNVHHMAKAAIAIGHTASSGNIVIKKGNRK